MDEGWISVGDGTPLGLEELIQHKSKLLPSGSNWSEVKTSGSSVGQIHVERRCSHAPLFGSVSTPQTERALSAVRAIFTKIH